MTAVRKLNRIERVEGYAEEFLTSKLSEINTKLKEEGLSEEKVYELWCSTFTQDQFLKDLGPNPVPPKSKVVKYIHHSCMYGVTYVHGRLFRVVYFKEMNENEWAVYKDDVPFLEENINPIKFYDPNEDFEVKH